jgi:hypothetical protein
MTRVFCRISESEAENEEGRLVPCIVACCSECGHETESFGTGEASVKRCLVLMRKECPERRHHFYAAAGGG